MIDPNSPIETRTAIRNFSEKEIVVILEPWAEEFIIRRRSEIIFVGYGPYQGNGFSVDYREDGIIVTAWTRSVVRVISDSIELGGNRPPVPDFD
jgi:hypothetical protein